MQFFKAFCNNLKCKLLCSSLCPPIDRNSVLLFCNSVHLPVLILKIYKSNQLVESKHCSLYFCQLKQIKGVFAKNERGYRLTSKNKLLKTTNAKERSVHTNSEIGNIPLGS